jgi:uncharacterized protein YggE
MMAPQEPSTPVAAGQKEYRIRVDVTFDVK